MIASDGINLMLFNIYITGIGFDARQISGLTPYNNEIDNVVSIHDLLSLPEKWSNYSNPRLMSIRDKPDLKILIEEPYDIINVNHSQITPLPRIMKTKVAGCGLWGLFFENDFLYSLYDTRILAG